LDTIKSTAETTQKAAREISDEEEYFVGRAVAARIISSYPLSVDESLTVYINKVGQAVALHSEKPYTYGGYHFALLDSDEVNAFACPGGTILITTGMLKTVRNEDELAAVLAHEIAHVNNRDGIAAIKKITLDRGCDYNRDFGGQRNTALGICHSLWVFLKGPLTMWSRHLSSRVMGGTRNTPPTRQRYIP
jgi:hypothetical protein